MPNLIAPLTRSWMGKWTWMNNNNKHKHHNSNSVNFSMMMKLKVLSYGICNHIPCIIYIQSQQNKSIRNFSFMVSQTVYFTGMMVFTLISQMYHRILVLVPVLVRVPEYFSTSTSTSASTITLELTSTSTVRVPEIQYCEYEYWVRVPQPWSANTFPVLDTEVMESSWDLS